MTRANLYKTADNYATEWKYEHRKKHTLNERRKERMNERKKEKKT